MMDALLFSARNAVRAQGWGYDYKNCNIMNDGHPDPRCGDIFVSIHQLATSSDSDNCLMEYFNFAVTLTQRVVVPLDRVGDAVLANELARQPGPNGSLSFNARVEQLRAFLHMAWGILQDANTFIANLFPTGTTVYGFCEPARYRGAELPHLVGGEWFAAEPDAESVGLVSQLSFEGARRMQPIALFR